MPRLALLLLAAAAVAACQKARSDNAQPNAADTVAVAEAEYNPAVFDTVKWVSDSLRLARGADVFKWGCAECHGPQGRGDGGKVTEQGDTLKPPDFQQVAWRLAGDTEAVRRKVYTGNTRGMPHWGLRRMEPRDIDAVAAYVLTVRHSSK